MPSLAFATPSTRGARRMPSSGALLPLFRGNDIQQPLAEILCIQSEIHGDEANSVALDCHSFVDVPVKGRV